MLTRTVVLLVAFTLALAAFGCAADNEPEPDVTAPPANDDAAGLRLAPGLYDLEDGTVQALGTLDYRDLEGGFWAIVSNTGADPAEGTVVAVIAPGTDLDQTFAALEGKMVLVTGTRFEGVSTRMAGPEIVPTAVEEITDTPGVAE